MTLFDLPDDDAPRRISLTRLSGLIAQAVSTVGRVAVEGEVHKPQSGRTGRQWFTLRDRVSQISVSVPSARRGRCRVVAGERVCVTGRLEWVTDWGQLQLVAEEVVPVGEGAIAAMIAEARARLDADGLLRRPRRPVPRLPAAIGVVCGHEAAVRKDIESVVAARFPGYPVVFAETTVSGPGAVDNVIAAMADLDARPGIDVIILARGGGDATALLPFSDEGLCRAVCVTRAPVVSAIGHDGDRPLVDEVADLRAGTPSLAAAAVVPDRLELAAVLDGAMRAALAALAVRLDGAAARLGRVDRAAAATAALDRARARLDHAAATRALVEPARELDRARVRLAAVDRHRPARARAERAATELSARWAAVEAMSPARVLERGYAVVRRAEDAAVVREPSQAPPGALLDITVAGGELGAVVR
ncbi:MAG TPA: exodeoxyribonuclease VII large subunit [Acidimicrobiales bacterium]|nr:exodeoxyribonuclease VII large subunit [Acidimicrobiales bacterium]